MESIYDSQVDPQRPNDAHGISLQLVGQGKSVLELGAAAGHVTKALKSLHNTVTAVERDGRFRDQLADLADEVIITDLDWLDLRDRLTGRKFDVVLAGDVLEHCSKPELVLLQLHDLLNPDGYVVISLPNIAHADVRLALLAGEFNYRDTGLLDRTHLRFFTRSSIEIFLTQNDFEMGEIFASTASIGTTELGPPKADIPIEAIDFVQQDRDSLVYQYIVKASPVSRDEASSFTARPARTNDAQLDQLLAEVCMYQDAMAHTAFANREQTDRIFQLMSQIELVQEAVNQLQNETDRARSETENIRHLLLTSQHETNLANLLVHDLEIRALEFEQRMELEKSKRIEADIRFLDARDHAIGAAAELGELRFQHNKALREIDSLAHQLNVLHGSRTWRIGRFMLLPLRALRKTLRLIIN
jgi:2-polyprenyl-3-methyl-5-hydroxy-6-metoxy-1,4-benzoquinol methylase